jgi:hypothetical protein
MCNFLLLNGLFITNVFLYYNNRASMLNLSSLLLK